MNAILNKNSGVHNSELVCAHVMLGLLTQSPAHRNVMSRARKVYIVETHTQILSLIPKLDSLHPNLQYYSARYGILHGVLANKHQQALKHLIEIVHLYQRAALLQGDTISILLDDIRIVQSQQVTPSLSLIALQEIFRRYQGHLLAQQTPIEELVLQLFLEHAVASPITRDALDFWKNTYPRKNLFLQKEIPNNGFPPP